MDLDPDPRRWLVDPDQLNGEHIGFLIFYQRFKQKKSQILSILMICYLSIRQNIYLNGPKNVQEPARIWMHTVINYLILPDPDS